MKIQLGAKVIAPGKLFRSREGDVRRWYRPSWKQRPVTGIYIGVRTYKNGTITWEGYEEGHTFHPKEYIKVALIVTDVRQNPVPVLFSEMSEVGEQKDE